jgi:shikimate kinase
LRGGASVCANPFSVNVTITGFMGAGKSTAGRRLARLLRIPFVDSDVEIERAYGPIAAMFEREGEAVFRARESETIARLCGDGPQVLAVGGGAVLDPANRAAMRRNGCIVNLALRPETAYSRVAHRTHRPLLGPVPTLETIRALMAERAAAYADNDLSISVDTRSPSSIAHIIARWYVRKTATEKALPG